jgi:hypothetical protein
MALESAPPLKATTKGGKWSKACKAWVNGCSVGGLLTLTRGSLGFDFGVGVAAVTLQSLVTLV